MCVALQTVLDAKLHKDLVGNADSVENFYDHAVLIVLGKHLVAVAFEAQRVVHAPPVRVFGVIPLPKIVRQPVAPKQP
jgi:hypothetical protein